MVRVERKSARMDCGGSLPTLSLSMRWGLLMDRFGRWDRRGRWRGLWITGNIWLRMWAIAGRFSLGGEERTATPSDRLGAFREPDASRRRRGTVISLCVGLVESGTT